MAHPTHKHTKRRRDKRRANWRLSFPSLTACPQCAQPVLPHRVCTKCGYYRGRQVVVIKAKPDKKKRQAGQT